MKCLKVLGKTFLINFCTILSIITCLVIIIQVKKLTKINLRLDSIYIEIFQFIALTTPYTLFTILPLVVLLSISFTFYKYRQNEEILAMMTLGLNPKKITYTFIFITVWITAIHYIIAFYAVPQYNNVVKNNLIDLKNKYSTKVITAGKLLTIIPGFVLYFNKKIDDNTFEGIFISDTRKTDAFFVAKMAQLQQYEDNIGFILIDGMYKETNDNNQKSLQFHEYVLNIKTKQNAMIEINDSVTNIFKFKEYSGKAWATFVQQIIWPLYSILFIVLATICEFNFYYKNYKANKNLGFVLITIISFCMIIINFMLKNLMIKNFHWIFIILSILNLLLPIKLIVLFSKYSS